MVHGGILATLVDEIAGWYLHAIHGIAGVTSDLSVKFLRPARIGNEPFRIATTEVHIAPKRASVGVEISGEGGSIYCTGECVYALFSDAVARKRLGFPGKEAFIETE